MSTGDSDRGGATIGVESMVDRVISTGKAVVKQVGAEHVRRFIENQPDVTGQVTIENVRGSGGVGASSGLILFSATYDADSGPVTRDLVLRHAPGSDQRLFFEYDLVRQFTVQRALQGTGVPVPRPLWLDAQGEWLGVPGYVMEFCPGVAPHPSAFMRGPLAEASSADRARMIDETMSALVKIHTADIKGRGLESFQMNAPGDSPMRRCVNWYWKTWEWVRVPQYERLVPIHRWLLDHAPNGEPELMHGDSTLHNYLFHERRLVAIVDWEMSALGRAEADIALQCVGNELFAAPKDSGALQPPTDAEWIALYRRAGGRPMQDFQYFKKFAAYMIVVAVSALQRNMTPEMAAAQEPLLRPLWKLLEN
ncbi:MAG: phosphotransferase family protein [Steroidobacteraceae bacterium]